MGQGSGAAIATTQPAEVFNPMAFIQFMNPAVYMQAMNPASEQVTIGDNNHPAVTLRIQFAADGKLAADLPVKININDN